MQNNTLKTAVVAALIGLNTPTALYAELNTALPGEQEETFSVPLTLDLPAQPLAAALRQFAIQSDLSLTVDSALIVDKKSPAVKGRMTRKEAVRRLLEGSGLQGKIEGEKILIQRAPKEEKQQALQLEKVEVRAKRAYDIGPLKGLALTKEEIPGNVQSISAKEIKESKAVSLTDLMNSKLQSVNVVDYISNPFQMDVTYRGFTASPQLGTAQGLSVFLDGIRVNEPFGDVVNWDMIPLNALAGLDVFPGSNPLFGLGTLGGALSMKTKSGFDSNEGSVEYLGGSFKRNQFQGSVGGNNGVVAGFASANIFKEDGWRVNSPSEVNQLFTKTEWRNDRLQLGLSVLYAGNKLVGNGLLPTEMAREDSRQVFTSPDETRNRLLQFQLSGIWDVSDTFNITGQIYKRKSKRNTSTADINQDFGGYATRRPEPGEQVIPGYSDINNDGLPDYNAIKFNVAADANGFALDTDGNAYYVDDGSGTGNFMVNPAWNGTPLVGTNALDVVHANQAVGLAPDGVTMMPNWVSDPSIADPYALTPIPELFNAALPQEFYAFALDAWKNKSKYVTSGNPDAPFGGPLVGQPLYRYDATNAGFGTIDSSAYYYDKNNFIVAINTLPLVNADEVFIVDEFGNLGSKLARSDRQNRLGKPYILWQRDANGQFIVRDGAQVDANGISNNGSGYVQGTPNAVITKTQIDQVSDGASIQFNWNLDKHKFMIGASIDANNAKYASGQYLGLLDAQHQGTLAPDRLGYEYYAASNPISLNDFDGKGMTKSIYLSETWKPIETLSLNASARYNATTVTNHLATNNIIGVRGPNSFINMLDLGQLCPDSDGDGTVESSECKAGIDDFIIPFGPASAFGLGALGEKETERFHYYSFNPSLGATWQANEATNLYANWSRGARTPSVIELGCAFDDTPIPYIFDNDGNPVTYRPRSLAERRFCSLPSTMSGDPYLKQVRSTSTEIGARGTWGEYLEWNIAGYRTDLQDDIYFVSFRPERSFFQNIGNTRRQGVEMGLKAKMGNLSLGLNYALTDATFQSAFKVGSPNNSEAGATQFGTQCSTQRVDCNPLDDFEQIRVKPGNRMPGVPLHNLNMNVNYAITPDWNIGITAILHSSAFVRGNENNKHKPGPATPVDGFCQRLINIGDPDGDGIDSFNTENYACKIARPDFKYPGSTPGYTVFNFHTTYKITKNLTAGLLINNLFDKKFYSAGRLGINPFSPSIRGAIDPVSGFNYNSNDWLATTFLAPGAPRSAFFTLTYDFDVGK